MTVYPDIITGIRSVIPLDTSRSQLSYSTEFEDGYESRRLIWSSYEMDIVINYSAMSYSDSIALIEFYESVNGPYGTFSFFMPHNQEYIKELAGVLRSGLSATIILPSYGAETSRTALYKNGIALTPLTDYKVDVGAGPDGEDLALLGVLAIAGDVFHFTFDGKLKIKARFYDEPLIVDDIKKQWSSTTVKLKGLKPSV